MPSAELPNAPARKKSKLIARPGLKLSEWAKPKPIARRQWRRNSSARLKPKPPARKRKGMSAPASKPNAKPGKSRFKRKKLAANRKPTNRPRLSLKTLRARLKRRTAIRRKTRPYATLRGGHNKANLVMRKRLKTGPKVRKRRIKLIRTVVDANSRKGRGKDKTRRR